MIQILALLNEVKCWKGYKKQGTKQLNGKTVNNCVPISEKESIPGGLSSGLSITDIAKKHDPKGYYHIHDMIKTVKSQIKKGIPVEMEHTGNAKVAAEIAKDHVAEDLHYYDKLKKAHLETEDFCPQCLAKYIEENWNKLEESEYHGRKVTLGKPFLTPDGPKKRSVYVKNAKGNVVKVNFGQKGVAIKKHLPNHRKSYRARHHCENPGPKWKANYWSCRAW